MVNVMILHMYHYSHRHNIFFEFSRLLGLFHLKLFSVALSTYLKKNVNSAFFQIKSEKYHCLTCCCLWNMGFVIWSFCIVIWTSATDNSPNICSVSAGLQLRKKWFSKLIYRHGNVSIFSRFSLSLPVLIRRFNITTISAHHRRRACSTLSFED